MSEIINRLTTLIEETTFPFSKGQLKFGEEKATFADLPSVENMPPHLVKVDCFFAIIGVDPASATTAAKEVDDLLKHYPNQAEWKAGLSYPLLGHWVDSNTLALQIFAFGQYLGWWDIKTPRDYLPQANDRTVMDMAMNGRICIAWSNREATVVAAPNAPSWFDQMFRSRE